MTWRNHKTNLWFKIADFYNYHIFYRKNLQMNLNMLKLNAFGLYDGEILTTEIPVFQDLDNNNSTGRKINFYSNTTQRREQLYTNFFLKRERRSRKTSHITLCSLLWLAARRGKECSSLHVHICFYIDFLNNVLKIFFKTCKAF